MPEHRSERARDRERIDARMIAEAPILGGEHRFDRVRPDLVERHPARAGGVVRAHLAEQPAVAIEEARRLRSRRARAELRRQRRHRRRDDERDHRRQEGADDDAQDAPEPGRADHFAFTSKIVAPVRPNTAGSYMHSARVGGITNLPIVVARARYR